MADKHQAAKYAFYYALALITLGFVAIALGQVAFELINKTIPEINWTYSGVFSQEIVKFAIAALIVAGPIYFFTTRQINKELAQKKMDPHSGVRRWLTYLILLAASVVTIGFLITILMSFLSGDLTSKFALKAISAIVIALGFGSYYVYDLSRTKFTKNGVILTYSIVFILVWVGALVTAFSIIDSPAMARDKKTDEARINELRSLTYQIQDYWQQHENQLPATLSVLEEDSQVNPEDITDNATDKQYEYIIQSATEYELCADFATSDQEVDRDYHGYTDPNWEHAAGRQCFQVTVTANPDKNWIDSQVRPVQ